MDNLPSIESTIKKYKLAPNKTLGQNFLFDSNITDHIAHSCYDIEGSTVLEIGPGPGGLTRSILAAGAKKVIAVEFDTRCVQALEELKLASNNKLSIINKDALTLPIAELKEKEKIHIISNLPYNIGTKLIMNWLNEIEHIASITVMLQKEVVERFIAQPKTSNFGRVSIIGQSICNIESLFDVDPENFIPPPKVTSSIMRLIPLKETIYKCPKKSLERLCAAAFSQRRKMVRKNLKTLFVDKVDQVLNETGIDLKARAEEISVTQFCRLAEIYHSINSAA